MALNQRERYLLAAPVVLVAAISFFSYIHQPLFAALAETRSDLTATRTQLARDRARLKGEGDLAQREALLSQQQRDLADRVPGRRSATVLIYHLAQAERESGVVVRQIILTLGPTEGDLQPINVSLQAEGSFLSHVLFNQAAEGIPVFLSGEGLELTRTYAAVMPASSDGKAVPPSASALARLAYAPPLAGAYRFVLQMRPADGGPDTAGLSFSDSLGRNDPFAESAVAALSAELQAAFPSAKVQLPPGLVLPAAPAPETRPPAPSNSRPAPELG